MTKPYWSGIFWYFTYFSYADFMLNLAKLYSTPLFSTHREYLMAFISMDTYEDFVDKRMNLISKIADLLPKYLNEKLLPELLNKLETLMNQAIGQQVNDQYCCYDFQAILKFSSAISSFIVSCLPPGTVLHIISTFFSMIEAVNKLRFNDGTLQIMMYLFWQSNNRYEQFILALGSFLPFISYLQENISDPEVGAVYSKILNSYLDLIAGTIQKQVLVVYF